MDGDAITQGRQGMMSESKRPIDDLIEALQILAKYANDDYPTHCEHDILTICCVDPNDVSDADRRKLGALGFSVGTGYSDPRFHSYLFGSA